jgi:hypothetical protein
MLLKLDSCSENPRRHCRACVDLVIPGCALLGADPESSTVHCSGFRVRSLSNKIDFVNFAQSSRPGMTEQDFGQAGLECWSQG